MDDDAGLWATATATKPLNPDWRAALLLQSRLYNDGGTLERLVIRPSLTRDLSPEFAVTLGYDAHLIEDPGDRVEHRVWQQGGWSRALGRLRGNLLFRLEERFIENVSGAALRGRVLVEARWPSGLEILPDLIVRDEVFVNLNEPDRSPRGGFDQNRLFAGFAGTVSDRFKAEIGYQMQYIERLAADLLIHQAALAVSVRFD